MGIVWFGVWFGGCPNMPFSGSCPSLIPVFGDLLIPRKQVVSEPWRRKIYGSLNAVRLNHGLAWETEE